MLFLDGLTVPRAGRLPHTFCRSWDQQATVLALSRVGHTFIEFLNQDSAPGKLFLDRDIYVDNTAPTTDEIDGHMHQVRDNVQQIVDRLSTKNNNLSFVIATRHGFCKARGQYKLSFRPFIQGMSIRYTHIPVVIKILGQQGFWDMSVYKAREQLLAAINGCKGRVGQSVDERILRPEACSEQDLLMYVAQLVDPDWPFLDVPLDVNAVCASPVTSCVGRPTTDPAAVRRMVACLSAATADDRMKWIVIGMVLKEEGSGDTYYEDWLQFSRRGCKFAGEEDCAKTWAGLRCSGMCGIGTLRFHARQGGYGSAEGSSSSSTPGARILRAMKNM